MFDCMFGGYEGLCIIVYVVLLEGVVLGGRILGNPPLEVSPRLTAFGHNPKYHWVVQVEDNHLKVRIVQ